MKNYKMLPLFLISFCSCYYPGTYVFTWTAVSPRDSETRLSLFESGRETGHHLWSDRNGYQSASQTAVCII